MNLDRGTMINTEMNLSENLLKTAVVIFGVTGDLTSRKLIPAIYELYQSRRANPTIFKLFGMRSD